MNTILKLIFKKFFIKYNNILRRIHDLEIITHHLLHNTQWSYNDSIQFNGQKVRQEILTKILSKIKISNVLETGSFIGNTTGYFAYLLPTAQIKSCELSTDFFQIAKQRLTSFKNIELVNLDSRTFLNTVKFNDSGIEDVYLIYLDAHWHSDLPLKEELEIISKKYKKSIIIIDDFQVPGDPNYGFDNYGKGKSLTLKDYEKVFINLSLKYYFPSKSSNEETGFKRGSIFLTSNCELSGILGSIDLLKSK